MTATFLRGPQLAPGADSGAPAGGLGWRPFFSLLFLPSGALPRGPQPSRARRFLARRSAPLTARTAGKPSSREGKASSLSTQNLLYPRGGNDDE